MQKLPPEQASINSLKYASITHAAITNKNLFNAYSYHVIVLKMELSASSSNSADADAATSLEASKPHQPRTFSFPKRQFGKSKPVLRSFQAGWFGSWSWLHYHEATDSAFCFYALRLSGRRRCLQEILMWLL